ncbi:chromosome segregation during meiosis domain-containing protein [Sarocladium implicatum]|nr:chromosome segregation during meiosis domain-containing protein [Sarocladium implicatum]
MPIFQADLDSDRLPAAQPQLQRQTVPLPDPAASRLRRLSEESLRTELCEGPVPDSPPEDVSPSRSPSEIKSPQTPLSDRADLIERLKRAQSPPWLTNRRVESFLQSTAIVDPPRPPRSPSASSATSLLPAAQITPEKDRVPSDIFDSRLKDGLEIQRPGSALHSGDFTHDDSPEDHRLDSPRPRGPDTSRLRRNDDWLATSPPRNYTSVYFDHRRGLLDSGTPKPASSLSSSVSSSFVYKAPTSPLVQSESNEELDFSTSLYALERHFQRRHTLNSASSSPFASPPIRSSMPSRVSLHRREGSLPYQAHQPRRSLTGTPNLNQLSSSPQTPALMRSRRQSFGSDSSPLHHASMVGSYEESILRGRMSTTPSKPLDFLAQIGVLGMGKCKSSLRCPPHVTLPFPAVYYSYSTTAHGRQRAEDGPSPYVGQVDLENGLSNATDGSRSKRKAQSRYADRSATEIDIDSIMVDQDNTDGDARQPPRSSRRPNSPRAPPGGSYRIPEKGQIQIIVKNQNKTAVKLFLVPYDLAGMEPGTKTFIRQRSYSAGSIIEGVPASSSLDAPDRPVLRYLVHLHVCCPAKGRFFLYKSIRIVFANRVPDGKEKLRNETTLPEPRFTPYKPIRVMHPPTSYVTGPGAMLAADKAYRRRSSGFSFGPSTHTFDTVDNNYVPTPVSFTRAASTASAGGNTLPIDPIPFRLPSRGGADSDNSDATTTTTGPGLRSPTSTSSRPSTKDSNGASNGFAAWDHGPARYEKLNKGDLGYGGNVFGPSASRPAGSTEGLLSQRLRSLGVDRQTQADLEEDQ